MYKHFKFFKYYWVLHTFQARESAGHTNIICLFYVGIKQYLLLSFLYIML